MKYEIKGEPLPVVVCNLSDGETMITERGAMSWMTPNIEMKTSAGGLGKALGRMFTKESIFQNFYTARGDGLIAFASSFPGSIIAVDITPEKGIVAQKSSFLAAEQGVNLSVHFNKRFSSGLLGGEGFLMQKLSGTGKAFIEIDGHCVQYNLKAGQQMVVDTGYLAAMDESVKIEVKTIKGGMNVLFGGEGFFNTVLTGPGNIWLQTMPVVQFAGTILPYLPARS
ncbi:MAG: TIGR00266 family protein [Clostridia bacterium]|nr:TIGR00266 family protein [Clostridia bacterium]